MGEVLDRRELAAVCERERALGRRVVFTNGCFDLIHPGHVRYLRAARGRGDLLVVGVNDDASVRRLDKGQDRPILGQDERAEVLAALEMVSYVCLFSEDTPRDLIAAVRPNVLVKGGDWPIDQIVGADLVVADGGEVASLPYHEGLSTTAILERIRGGHGV